MTRARETVPGKADERMCGKRGDASLRGPCKALDLVRDVFERIEERSLTMRGTVIRALLGWS